MLDDIPYLSKKGRIACNSELQKTVGGIRGDIFNLSGTLAKLELPQGLKEQITHGFSRICGPRVEHIMLVWKSVRPP